MEMDSRLRSLYSQSGKDGNGKAIFLFPSFCAVSQFLSIISNIIYLVKLYKSYVEFTGK